MRDVYREVRILVAYLVGLADALLEGSSVA